jgi:hypothetical protein
MIVETLTTYLLDQIEEDKREEMMIQEYGSDSPTLAERAISLQLLLYRGTLRSLLQDHWKTPIFLPMRVTNFLEKFNVGLRGAASIDEFGFEKAYSAFGPESVLWRNKVVLAARAGQSLPDILFTSKNQEGGYCMVSIQVKTSQDRLTAAYANQNRKEDKDSFGQIILNTSRTHFFHNTDQAPHFLETWKQILEQHKVYHIRVIISFAGFTYQQIGLVNEFNENNPGQPIVLISPSRENVAQLYGPDAYKAICQKCTQRDPWETKIYKTKIPEKMQRLFTELVLMELLEQEVFEEEEYEFIELAEE